jgi:hypothetical protein
VPHPATGNTGATTPLQLVLMDLMRQSVWSLLAAPGTCSCCMMTKASAVINVLTGWQTSARCQVMAIRTDRDTEFLNKTLEEWLVKGGVQHQTSAVGVPQQNGAAECMKQSLTVMVRCMLQGGGMEGEAWEALWAEAYKAAAFIKNCLPFKAAAPHHRSCSTPSSHWDVSRVRVWGCRAYVLTPKQQRDGKLDRVSELGIFVGYANCDTAAGGWADRERVQCLP